jgi:branched-chain amino acid transport system permease protein
MRSLDPRVARALLLLVGAVVAIGLPFAVTNFQAFEFSYVLIFAIALLGLNVLTGYSGQISLGHGAFIAVGAFVTAIGTHRFGMNYLATLPLAALAAGVLGFVIGLPALRLEGIYLALATFALGVGAPDVLRKPASITGGVRGIILPPVVSPFDWLADEQFFYYICLAVAVIVFFLSWNLLRGRTGRAWRAIRDGELAARSSGVNIAAYKTLAFAISAAWAGAAGGLLALANGFVSADGFQVQLSIALLVGAIIGGIGTIEGAVIGGLVTEFLPIYAQQVLLPINKQLANAAPGATQGLLLLLIMFLARDGIAGLIRTLYLRLRVRAFGRRAVDADAEALPTAVG